jgi:hypothetical protein
MPLYATGTFEVKLTPQTSDPQPSPARMTIDKHFHGDLEALSQGQMLSVMTGTKGSAGYVAMEVVSGTLGGRNGTFALQHSGTMDRGQPRLSVTVVPDSGTDELLGLSGAMQIRIESGGKHFYDFEYQLSEVK